MREKKKSPSAPAVGETKPRKGSRKGKRPNHLSFKDIDVIYDLDSTLFSVTYFEGQTVEIVKRPGLDYLYSFCQRKCRSVSFWTAGEPHWVDTLKQTVLKDMNFLLELNRVHCVPTVTSEVDLSYLILREQEISKMKSIFYAKDLSLLWNSEEFKDYNFAPSTTLIVDDYSVGLYQNPHNLYKIKRYDGGDDSELFRFCCWMEGHDRAGFTDIRTVDKCEFPLA